MTMKTAPRAAITLDTEPLNGRRAAIPSGMARFRLGIFLLLLLSLAPMAGVRALILSDIELSSRLGEPLEAYIPLLELQPNDIQTIRANLADPTYFSRAGLQYPAPLKLLKFEIVPNRGGAPHIRITSDKAIGEPFLNFIVEVAWSRGRILREYTLLLDPPTYAGAGRAMIGAIEEAAIAKDVPPPPPLPPESPKAEKSSAKTKAKPAKGGDSVEAVGAGKKEPADTGIPSRKSSVQYGPVTGRDTLWSIATRFRPNESVSIEQVMLALQRANPEAFSENNINALKAGAILRIPDREAITKLSRVRALAKVEEQHAAWEDIRQKLAKTPVTAPKGSPLPDDLAGEDMPGSKQTGRVEILSTGTAVEGVGSEERETPEKEAIKQLRAEVSLGKEELGAKNRENKELKLRLTDAEDLIRKFSDLMEIQSDEINALKARLAAARQADAEASAATDSSRIDSSVEESEESPEALPVSEEIPTAEALSRETQSAEPAIPEEEPVFQEEGKISGITSERTIGLPSIEKAESPAAEAKQSRSPKIGEPAARADGAASSREEGEPGQGSALREPTPEESRSFGAVLADLFQDNLLIIAAVLILGGVIAIFVVIASWPRGRSAEEESEDGAIRETDAFQAAEADVAYSADFGSGDEKLREEEGQIRTSPPAQEEKPAEPTVEAKKTVESETKLPPILRKHGGDAEKEPTPSVPDERKDPKGDNDIVRDIEAPGAEPEDGSKDDALVLESDGLGDGIEKLNLNEISSNVARGRNAAPKKGDAAKTDPTMPPTPEWALDFAGPELKEIDAEEARGDAGKAAGQAGGTGENLDFSFGFDLDVSPESESPSDSEASIFGFPKTDTSGNIDEMQTKLDLARAYTDMGDIEGAKVILEQVLADGEENHKGTARELLKKLPS
uniref:FimV N-terminal domain-containing protein n=1 Tax=Candidatus Kentrum sp. DK TaxID=2126562 RepID=A0A450RYL6_9GAMM|nr:MAG: FimV N-terminal domain-containing protein [Candidatus Kentron sp. DK]